MGAPTDMACAALNCKSPVLVNMTFRGGGDGDPDASPHSECFHWPKEQMAERDRGTGRREGRGWLLSTGPGLTSPTVRTE